MTPHKGHRHRTDKNSSMDIVSVCKPHCNDTKFKLPWEFRDVSKDVNMLVGLLTYEKKIDT